MLAGDFEIGKAETGGLRRLNREERCTSTLYHRTGHRIRLDFSSSEFLIISRFRVFPE